MELLVVITLLSLLSVGMLMAIRIGFNALERTNVKLMANRRVLGAQRALDQQIAGMIPVLVPCAGGPTVGRSLFLQGDARSMRFVSSFSLEEAARGYPRILEYAVIPGAQGRGVRLIVNEHLFQGAERLLAFCAGPGGAFRPVEPTPRSFVLADRLAGCRFSYLVEDARSAKAAWLPLLVAPAEPPLAVRIEMMPLEADPSRLQMGTVTVPIRVSRNALAIYKDIDDPDQP